MKILLISYGIIEYDGRLIELYNMAQNLGEVTLVCCGNKNISPDIHTVDMKGKKYLSLSLYLKFIFKALKVASKMEKFDVLFVDNYLAAPTGLLLKKLFKKKIIIQDVRELYFSEDMPSLKGKMLYRSEVKLLKSANVVLVANKYRADIMMEKYNLQKKPIVFENIRVLPKPPNGDQNIDFLLTISKYRVKIISTGGVSIRRLTGKLVESMSKLPSDYGLIIIGDGSESDLESVRNIINRNNLSNIHIVGKVPLNELYTLVASCDIGIVNYHKEDLNNQYCASGKVYEYLDAGLPIVTTENTPLKDFCESFNVGIADDGFYRGILEIGENLESYRNNVKDYMKDISVENYNKNIASRILEAIEIEG